ncbi:MAG TPA: hypothetical protein PKK18_08860 [Chitinophagales bacterium]|nr:hypothetical protein [Chitinophagales bacterium]HMX60980.1 hypothetical protein [Chitinophagales bacterium]HMZ32640.1 hypothetical protein [Chitinophagales bacterium]HNA38611.1 hypothetical protein [Chitinophagales bacterium]HNB49331.1 hypothetical protein [Chitinophagales bacterium]
MKKIQHIITVFLSVIALHSMAQSNVDTLPQLDEVDIVKAYEPILISSNKVPFSPNLPNLSKAKPDAQTYNYTDVKGNVTYGPEDIKPIKSAGKKPEKNQFFYAKIGAGFPITPLVKLIITNPVKTQYSAGLDLDFIMTFKNKKEYQNYTDLKVKGFGEYYVKKKAAIGAELYYRLNQHKFYGYANDVIFDKDSLKTNFNRFGGAIKLRGIEDANYYYNGDVNFASVINKNVFHKPKEITVGVNAEGGYNFKKNYWLGAKLMIANVHYKDNYQDTSFFAFLNNQNHFTIQAIPYGKIKFKIWQLKAGPNLIVTNRKFYVLPEIENQLQIYKDYFVMYNEWKTQVKINSLHNLSLDNPFIVTDNYDNAIDEIRTIAGFRGSVKGFGYDVRFSQLVSRNQAQYVNEIFQTTTDTLPQATFNLQNVNIIKAWNPHFALSYNKGSQFGAKAWFDYFIYNKNTAAQLSYLPKLKAGFSAFYNWNDKLYVSLDVTGHGKVNAVQHTYDDTLAQTTTLIPIKGLVDVNLSANYFITKNIGVFVDLNNLGFQKWQRFYRYPSYNFQVIAGVKLSFK